MCYCIHYQFKNERRGLAMLKKIFAAMTIALLPVGAILAGMPQPDPSFGSSPMGQGGESGIILLLIGFVVLWYLYTQLEIVQYTSELGFWLYVGALLFFLFSIGNQGPQGSISLLLFLAAIVATALNMARTKK
jgi:FtsH-binding integral membrane protein